MQDEPSYKRENLVNPHRLLKGDLNIARDAAGYINRAEVSDNSVLGYLVRRGAFGHDHIRAAATYALWQYAFTRPFFAEPRKLYLMETLGAPVNGGRDEACYRKLLRRVTRNEQQLVEMAISDDARANSEGRDNGIDGMVAHLSRAFDILMKHIDEIEGEMEKLVAPEKESV